MEAKLSIDDRVRLLIAATIPDRMRYIELEAATGISADTWKNFWFKRRKADGEMIEKVCRAHPEYAFWLATGATNVTDGHVCPPNAECIEPQRVPLQTAINVLYKAVAATQAIEKVYAGNTGFEEQAAEVLHGFLHGRIAHTLPDKLRWPIDDAFKAVQAFNLAVRLSQEERKL